MSDPPARSIVQIPDHELLRVIGRGSYGEVWLARNLMGTLRAVKIVQLADFEHGRPFEREFEGIKRYEPVSRSHGGLVQVLHIGMGNSGDYFYYVMELADDARAVDGPATSPDGAPSVASVVGYQARTLRQELHRRGGLPVAECVEIGLVLARALGHLHAHGLVHRDVKPANIIFVNGRAKLADVGLVALMSDSRSMVGTEGYTAPEGTGQPRSDVYSLAKVLYECVTGHDRLRFPDVPDAWLASPPPATRAACFELMEIILRAGESDPRQRYASTVEMVADLALLQAGKSLRHLRRIETRLRRAWQVLAVAVLLIAVAAGAWGLEWSRRERIERAEHAERLAKQEARGRLAESLMAQARATRLSGEAGAREKSLAAVAEALEVPAPIVPLRTQASSALALVDIGDFGPPWPPNVPPEARTVVSRTGDFAASGVVDGKIQVWRRDANGPVPIATLPADRTAPPTELAISGDGRWLVVTEADHRVRVWEVAAARIVREWPPCAFVPSVALAADGTWMVVSQPDGLIAAETAGTGSTILLPGPRPLRSLVLAPNGTWLAALPEGQKGIVVCTGLPGDRFPHDPASLKIVLSPIESDIELVGPSISGDSRYLAAAVSEDRLRVWEVPSMAQMAWLRGHQRTVRGTAFHPLDSSLIASTGWDGTTRWWDIPSRQQVLVAPVGGEQITVCPARQEVVLRSWDGRSIRAAPLHWPRAARLLVLPPRKSLGLFASVAFSPDGRALAAAGEAGVVLWDLATGDIHDVEDKAKYPWHEVTFAPDGQGLWCSGGNGLFRHALTPQAGAGLIVGAAEQIIPEPTRHLSWIGDRLAVGMGWADASGHGSIRILHPGADTPSPPLISPYLPDQLSASPDGRWLATTRFPGGGGTLWDLSQSPPSPVPVESPQRCAIAFLPHHPAVAVGWDSAIRFDPLPGYRPSGLPGPLERQNASFVPGRVVASPDGTIIAASTGATDLTLYDAHRLTKIATLDSPLTPFDFSLAFSPDSAQLAVAGGVSRVMVWDLRWLKDQLSQRGLGW